MGDFFAQFAFCLLICGAKICEISIQSIKTVSMVKGQRILATCLAFVECMIWGLVCSSVISGLNSNFFWLFSYCLGYALGIFVGSKLEAFLALGTSSLQLVIGEKYIEKTENFLKEHEKGYTVIDGHGAKGKTYVVIIALPRKEVKKIIEDIKSLCDNQVFVITSEVSKFVGGYGVRK